MEPELMHAPYRRVELWVEQEFPLPFADGFYKKRIRVLMTLVGIPVSAALEHEYDTMTFPEYTGMTDIRPQDKARHREELLAYARRAGVLT